MDNDNNQTEMTSSTLLLISDETVWWIRMLLVGVASQSIALLGTVTNIISIIVFIKMGVKKDPMNISLLGLSISDFIGCFTILWSNLCYFPPFMNLHLPFQQTGASYLFGMVPHVTLVKVTVLITAFITVERCLCVTFPFKVKQLITWRRVSIVIASIYILNFALVAPIYYVYYYDWVFYPDRNRTVYTMLFRQHLSHIQSLVAAVHGFGIPLTAFSITTVATAILVYKLKQSAKWRKKATSTSLSSSTTTTTTTTATLEPSKSEHDAPSTSFSSSSRSQAVSSRDTKAAKMVVMISALYIICFCPVVVFSIVMITVPEIMFGGALEILMELVFYCTVTLETTNGSLNFFIYLYMSTNFQDVVKKMFNCREIEDK